MTHSLTIPSLRLCAAPFSFPGGGGWIRPIPGWHIASIHEASRRMPRGGDRIGCSSISGMRFFELLHQRLNNRERAGEMCYWNCAKNLEYRSIDFCFRTTSPSLHVVGKAKMQLEAISSSHISCFPFGGGGERKLKVSMVKTQKPENVL